MSRGDICHIEIMTDDPASSRSFHKGSSDGHSKPFLGWSTRWTKLQSIRF